MIHSRSNSYVFILSNFKLSYLPRTNRQIILNILSQYILSLGYIFLTLNILLFVSYYIKYDNANISLLKLIITCFEIIS
jgi:hypothetical protein